MKVLSIIMYLLLTAFYITVIVYGIKNAKNIKNFKLSSIFYADWEKDYED